MRATVLAHHPWGVTVRIAGNADVAASVDMIAQFGATVAGDELYALFPPVGAEIDAVVQRVAEPPSGWVRLSLA